MSELGDILERESRDVDLPPGAFERLRRRRDRKHRTRRIATVVVALLIAIPATGVAIRALGGADVRKDKNIADTPGTLVITSDTTLTTDHHGSIVIGADDVTLDCAGYSVIGPSSDPDVEDGIVIDGYSGVTVRNCVVQQFAYGIVVRNASAGLLEDNEVRLNDLSGIDVTGSVDVIVRQNTMHENGLNTGYSGIDVEYGASDVVVAGNHSWGNGGNGFYIYQASNLVFDNNDAFSNSRGFDLDLEVTDSTFSNNRAVNNAGDGVSVVLSDNNRFSANEVSGNGGYGFQVHRSSGNVLRSNDVQGNSADGISLNTESSYNVIRDNDIERNISTGIHITGGSDWNILAGNVSSHNGEFGLLLLEATKNTMTGNVACQNAVLDARDEQGNGNVWTDNRFCTSDV
jgi:parallel beta-helix repeat protein